MITRLSLLLSTLLAVMAAPARAELTGAPLRPALPRVAELTPRPAASAIALRAGLRGWHGTLSHIAGASHYDRGEWIYEDYPFTAYGAAPVPIAVAQEALATLGGTVPASQRLPGAVAEVSATSGAGPFADEADVWQLRVAVRRRRLSLIASTTTMRKPVRTALLLLFDRGRSTTPRDIPFASGLRSIRADVAALVTAAGTRIVDLMTGTATTAPAVAIPDGYENSLATRIPLDLVRAPGAPTVRLVAAAGLVAPGTFALQSVAKVVPRTEPAVQAVYERAQALALAARDIDPFFRAISLTRLRRGDRERLSPGTGYSVRTMITPAERSKGEGATEGVVHDYGLYVPERLRVPAPATLLLRGSGMTAHSLPAISPGLTRQLGDGNGAVVISTGGRSGFDLYNGAAYLDALQALADARRVTAIDPDRLSVAGYSMGGYATYMLAVTQPDRFAAAFVVEGPVGGVQPAAKTPIVDAFADVVPQLSNLRQTPIAVYQGLIDPNVPITNGLSSTERLRALGYRYRLNLFPGEHFTPGVFDDYSVGARYLRQARRVAQPSEVVFTRDMTFERAIDTGSFSDAPLAGHSVGLRFDHAWFVHDLRAARPNGKATIDVRTEARAASAPTLVHTQGIDPGRLGGAPPSVFEEQGWRQVAPNGTPRNAFDMTLAGASHVTLDLAGMGLSVTRPLTATIHTDGPATVTLALPGKPCAQSIDLTLGAGEKHISLRAPCTRRRAAR